MNPETVFTVCAVLFGFSSGVVVGLSLFVQE